MCIGHSQISVCLLESGPLKSQRDSISHCLIWWLIKSSKYSFFLFFVFLNFFSTYFFSLPIHHFFFFMLFFFSFFDLVSSIMFEWCATICHICSWEELSSKFCLIQDMGTVKGTPHAFIGDLVLYIKENWTYIVWHLSMKVISWHHKGDLIAGPMVVILKKMIYIKR